MSCFYLGNYPGLPWVLCVIPVLCMLFMMFMCCRFFHKEKAFKCWPGQRVDLAGEVAELRRELEEMKKDLAK